jgi:hypothetical protein
MTNRIESFVLDDIENHQVNKPQENGFNMKKILSTDLLWQRIKSNEKLLIRARIMKLLVSRFLLLMICGLMIGFNICLRDNDFFFLFFLIPVFIIIAESLYICFKRDGRDFKWFSLTAFAYTILMTLSIWITSNDKYIMGNINCQNSSINHYQEKLIKRCVGVNYG